MDLLLMQRRRYFAKVLSTRPTAYWPLSETSGAVANDISGNGYHGAYTGVDLAQPGIGDGRTAPYFDGANDYTNVYSAGLAAAFNGAEGTLLVWARVADAGVWTDGASRYMMNLYVNASNRIHIVKSSSNNLVAMLYRANGTSQQHSFSAFTLSWLALALTWSAADDEVCGYANGVAAGVPLSGLGAWAGVLSASTTVIGAYSTTPTGVYLGWLGHAALWNRALTPTEVAEVSRL